MSPNTPSPLSYTQNPNQGLDAAVDATALGAGGPLTPSLPPPPMPWDQLRDVLEDNLKKLKTAASDNTNIIHQRCEALANDYSAQRKGVTSKQKGRDLNFWAKINESADQVDDESNLLMNLMTQDGRIAKVLPGDGEREERAVIADEALDFELRQGNVEDELELSVKNYVGMPFGGLKACREYYDGVNRFYFKAINPQCFAVSDVGRQVGKQFSIHELHYFTKREMRKAGFRNLDRLGKPDAHGKPAIIETSSNPEMPSSLMDNVGTASYKVWETWVAPTFQEWIDDGQVPPDQVFGFCQEWGIPVEYLWSPDENGLNTAECNLLRFFHSETGVILHVTINYLTTPKQFPHHCASFHTPMSKTFCGESMTERSSDIFSVQEVLFNDWLTNMRLIGNQSMFVSQRAQVSPDQLQKIYEPRGQVFYSGNEDPDMLFKFFDVPSIGKEMMEGIGFAEGKIEQAGVSSVMQGLAQSRTATENRNDNARGQMQVNAAGARFIRDCVLPASRDVLRMIISDYGEQWMTVIGEDGKVMMDMPPMTDPDQIDRHFQVAPVTSFDYIMQFNMVAELSNVMNVAAPLLPPDVGIRMAEVIVEHTRIPRKQKEYIFDKRGTLTQVADEIETLTLDPYAQIEVRDDDDHLGALQAVQLATYGDPETGQMPVTTPMWPMPFDTRPGVKKYQFMHQVAYMKQMEQMMQMKLMAAGVSGGGGAAAGNALKGNPKQITGGQVPVGQESQVRSEAQSTSPRDTTDKPGQTGRKVERKA